MNIGDYVRTRKGIDKIISYVGQQMGDNVYEVTQNGTFMPEDAFRYFVFESDIIKLSPNIIDLIEVGDYVNGYIVKAKDEKEGKVYFDYLKKSYPANIESVVTKEQFESMKYEIK